MALHYVGGKTYIFNEILQPEASEFVHYFYDKDGNTLKNAGLLGNALDLLFLQGTTAINGDLRFRTDTGYGVYSWAIGIWGNFYIHNELGANIANTGVIRSEIIRTISVVEGAYLDDAGYEFLIKNTNGKSYDQTIIVNKSYSEDFDLRKLSISSEGATYGFEVREKSGVPYLASTNGGKASSYAYAKIYFTVKHTASLTLYVSLTAQKDYDYGIFSRLDTELSQSTSSDSSKAQFSTAGELGFSKVTYSNVAKGDHFITVKYKKDSSIDRYGDALHIDRFIATYKNIPSVTFDLSAINLQEGTHTITVKAKAKNYENSLKSNAVSYVVESEGK